MDCMYSLHGLLPTFGENVMSKASLKILPIKVVPCSVLILPAVSAQCRLTTNQKSRFLQPVSSNKDMPMNLKPCYAYRH